VCEAIRLFVWRGEPLMMRVTRARGPEGKAGPPNGRRAYCDDDALHVLF
jgi:hypothetical protein